jgi:drug/metabolite transporter (DMT)-like permease
MTAVPASTPISTAARFAVPLLLLGAFGIAFSPIFMRLSELGPLPTGFWRLGLSVPLLGLWFEFQAPVKRGPRPVGRAQWGLIGLIGFFFAGDLVFWHLSVSLTSVANATLLANGAPVFVAIGARFLFAEKLTPLFLGGMAVAIAGALILMSGSFHLDRAHVLGDALALITALFYAGYQLALKRGRERFSTAAVMAYGGIVSAAFMLPVALASGQPLLPATLHGWLVLAGLAWISQLIGQSLIVLASAHLPASFSAIGLLLQPVSAAILAWALLGEGLGLSQIVGGLTVLAGILIVRRARS